MINEGFWDSITNSLKTRGLAAMSKFSNKAEGKLDSHLFSTAMYKQYKQYIGRTGDEVDYQSIAEFLINEIGFSKQFVIQVLDPNHKSSSEEENNKTNDNQEKENNYELPKEIFDKDEKEFVDDDNNNKKEQERKYSTLEYLKRKEYDDEQKLDIAKELLRLIGDK